ncbi:hypothetical protein EfsSVR2332_27170 [Enterococcus faecalis]|uniref:Uncharacterized protein n=1 Tax=Enterococcus faecalis TaxID=1351 RepID=A0AC59HSD7_ENTFL|nr:hypothetical protein EfsSVR2332_27170 [Enterococcus faecalis]
MSLKSKELIKTVVFFACLALGLFLLRQFVFTPVVVRGHSMDPTLADGERVITLKNTEINRFDIITFPAPDEPDKNYIKRVIGGYLEIQLRTRMIRCTSMEKKLTNPI